MRPCVIFLVLAGVWGAVPPAGRVTSAAPAPWLRTVFPNINLPSNSIFRDQAVLNRTMNTAISPNPAIFFLINISTTLRAQVNQSSKQQGFNTLNPRWLSWLVNDTAKADVQRRHPGYQYFGPTPLTAITNNAKSQDDMENALAILLKTNSFYVSALTNCNGSPCLQTKGTGLLATLIGPMDPMYPRVDSVYDNNLKMRSFTAYKSDGSVDRTVSKFDALMRTVFLMNYHAECLHATLHGLHYVMAAALVHAAYGSTPMANFAHGYTWNAKRAWDAVVDLDLGSDRAVLTGGTIKANRDKVLDNLQRTLGRIASYRTGAEFINKFLLGGVGTSLAATLGLLEDLKYQAQLLPRYAHDLLDVFAHRADYNFDTVEQRLEDFCKGVGNIDGQPIMNIQGLNGWIQVQAVTALMHTNTLSFTRFMATTVTIKSYSTSPLFTPWDAEYWRATAPTVVNMIPGYGLYEKGPFRGVTDGNVTTVLDRFLKRSTKLKSDAYARAVSGKVDLTAYGWLLSDFWMDGFDGRQITWLTYF